MIRKLALILSLVMFLFSPTAFAQEGIYMPGETAAQLFVDAFESGKIVKADIQLDFSANPDKLNLDEEEAVILSALSNATLTVGAGKIENGLRIEIGAEYGADMPVAADAALNIMYDGLLLESSLIEGEGISARWETLLALCGMDSQQAQMILSLRDADLPALAEQLFISTIPYIQMASQALTPYGETIRQAIAALPIETEENLPADGHYPAAAQGIYIPVTASDLGGLIIQLADQLENDAMLSMLISAALAELPDSPFSSAAQLCAAAREAGAAMTDTAHPVVFYAGLDNAGKPLYVGAVLQEESLPLASVEIVHAPGESPSRGAFSLGAHLYESEETVSDGLDISGTYFADPANPNLYAYSLTFGIRAEGEAILVAEAEVSQDASIIDGQQGYSGKQSFSFNIDDGPDVVSIVMTSESGCARTAVGGEYAQITGSLDVLSGEAVSPVTFACEFAAAPGAEGPTATYTETGSAPSIGIDNYDQLCTLYTATYDPAQIASLQILQLESATSEDIDALAGRIMQSAQAIVRTLRAELSPAAETAL